MHHLILMLSCLTQLMEAYTYKPARTVTLTEGQSATFTCLVYPEIWRSGRVQGYYAKYDKYLCRDPCGPHDWHLIVATTDKTLAPNRNPYFTITKLPNPNGAQITISDVKLPDAGMYWCGIEPPPPVINDSWFSWLKSLGQGGPVWFLTMIIPYVMIFFLLCTLIPCVLKCLSNVSNVKKMVHSFTYVQVNANIADQNSTSLHNS